MTDPTDDNKPQPELNHSLDEIRGFFEQFPQDDPLDLAKFIDPVEMELLAVSPTRKKTRRPKRVKGIPLRNWISTIMICFGVVLILIAGIYEAWDYPWYLLAGRYQADTPDYNAVSIPPPTPLPSKGDDGFIYVVPSMAPEDITVDWDPAEADEGIGADSIFEELPILNPKPPANSAPVVLTKYATITIPKLKISQIVFEGSRKAELKKGTGHVIGTTAVGKMGNTCIAGHRSTTANHPFKYLMEMEVGDQIYIEDNQENKFVYTAIAATESPEGQPWFIVTNKENWVMGRVKSIPYCLTLITCHPYTRATHRVILRAELTEVNGVPFPYVNTPVETEEEPEEEPEETETQPEETVPDFAEEQENEILSTEPPVLDFVPDDPT
jgi:LPXTG-site transpeptidase (sortase) family protein